jgi:hypothetical protein
MLDPEPQNTPPEAGKYFEPELQEGITQNPDDVRLDEEEL